MLSDDTIEVDCNGTLKFHSIRLGDAGEYICYVESFLGMDLALTHVEVVGMYQKMLTKFGVTRVTTHPSLRL